MSNEWEPVLTVETEPDYWSGGHFYEGTRPWINPTKVWALPIGTKLYTTPASATAQAVPRVEVCCLKFDTCRNQCVPLVDHLRGQIKELKAAPAVPQVQPDTFYERNAKFREENWQIRFDAAVEARRQAQELLYSERERHAHEVQALRQEISRLLPPQHAVQQGETVAWMVYGNYTRQPFGMLCSAEAYMGGLLKSDPDGGYHIRPLRYATPAPAQEIDKSVADAEIKSMYVESQGSDKGWLGIEGSYFIGGVVAARKQKAAPAPAQEVGLTDEALDNLIEDLSEWSRHVVEDTAHQTLEAHVREVLEKNPIIAALRAKGASDGR